MPDPLAVFFGIAVVVLVRPRGSQTGNRLASSNGDGGIAASSLPVPKPVIGRAFGTLSAALVVMATVGCGNPPGEFSGDGVVAGRIIYSRCSSSTPAQCIRAPIPRGASNRVGAAVIGRQLDGSGTAGAGVDPTLKGGWGDIEVPAGRWEFSVPILERPGCAPRVRFEVRRQLFYRVNFTFARPGHCIAEVWERPFGPGHRAHRLATAGT